MPKMKTKKAIMKRFKISAAGKVLRGHIGSRHRHSHKSKKRLRFFSEPLTVTKKQSERIKSLINQ